MKEERSTVDKPSFEQRKDVVKTLKSELPGAKTESERQEKQAQIKKIKPSLAQEVKNLGKKALNKAEQSGVINKIKSTSLAAKRKITQKDSGHGR
jgi:DNA topoisomerase VI subunit B